MLNISQMMTIGANMVPIFDVPNGCIKKSRTRMAQDTPTIVEVVMVASTMLRLQKSISHMGTTTAVVSSYPWMAPSTD